MTWSGLSSLMRRKVPPTTPIINPGRAHPSNVRLRAAAEPFIVGRGLEVGPFDRPFFLKEESDVEYLDYRDTANLREAAASAIGHNAEFVPEMDYVVSADGNWAEVPDARFQWILSSHALEHCPDLIAMFNTIAAKLVSGGVAITMLPDKRRTFDVHRTSTSLGRVLEDHLLGSRVSRPSAVFDQIFYMRNVAYQAAQATYDAARDQPPADGDFDRALSAAHEAMIKHIDTHNYVFTDATFRHIIDLLCEKSIIPFEHIYFLPTPDDDLTFLSVMRRR